MINHCKDQLTSKTRDMDFICNRIIIRYLAHTLASKLFQLKINGLAHSSVYLFLSLIFQVVILILALFATLLSQIMIKEILLLKTMAKENAPVVTKSILLTNLLI